MNLLAFDTSTDLMSVAVQRRVAGADTTPPVSQVWHHTGPGGALTSATLIPLIQQLMAQAGLSFDQLDALVFGCGPGSFTGLRTACSVAQGLAFGAHIKVLPINTLLVVAEEARWQQAPARDHYQVTALLDARMDEMYVARYGFHRGHWTPLSPESLMRPEALLPEADWPLAGNVFAAYGTRLAGLSPRIEVLPTASALLRLAPALLAAGRAVPADQALPIYIRDKVAQTTAERAALKVVL